MPGDSEKDDPPDDRIVVAFNRWYGKVKLDERIATVEKDVGTLKNDVEWLKKAYRSVDYRVWFITGGILIAVIGILLK